MSKLSNRHLRWACDTEVSRKELLYMSHIGAHLNHCVVPLQDSKSLNQGNSFPLKAHFAFGTKKNPTPIKKVNL